MGSTLPFFRSLLAARSLRYVAPADRTGPTGGKDIDEVAVERAVHGDRVALNTAERREAVRRLTVSGVSGPEIALRLGVCGRTVTRARAAVRRYGEPARP